MGIFTIEPDEDKKKYYKKTEELNWKKLSFLFFLGILGTVAYAVLKIYMPPHFEYSDNYYLDLDKKVHEYKNIPLKKGGYRVGFYVGKFDLRKEKNDGDYLLEYYCDNKLVRKIKNIKIRRNAAVHVDEDNGKNMIIIDYFSNPQDLSCSRVDLKLYTNKDFSLFENLNLKSPVTFYVRRIGNYMDRLLELSAIEHEKLKKLYPNNLSNEPIELYDSDKIKQEVMQTLFDKNLEEYKKLVKKYNLDINLEMGQDRFWKDTKRTALFYAAYLNDLKTVKYLIESNIDIHHKDFINKSVLQHAIEGNSIETVKYLLKKGLTKKDACYVYEHPNTSNATNKITPLHFAVKKHYYELFKALLENGFREIELDCYGVPKLGEHVSSLTNAMNILDGNKEIRKIDKNDPFAPETSVQKIGVR